MTPIERRIEGPVGEARTARAIWTHMLAGALGLIPFTIFSTLLVPIAADVGGDVALVGSLRGLGGITAFVVGVALAPVLDGLPHDRVAAVALTILSLSAVLAMTGTMWALVCFCLLTGAGIALLTPAVLAGAADRFAHEAASARAATLVQAATTLTAMLVGPLVALPATVWGWRGDFLAVAGLGVLLAVFLWTRSRELSAGRPAEASSFLATFRAVGRTAGALPLIAIAMLRTAAFMGCLAYLAALYDARFGLDPARFSIVWTVSGASFFIGTYWVGRALGAERWPATVVLRVGLVVATAAVVALHLTDDLIVAASCNALLALGHAAVAASVTTLLVRRSGGTRAATLSLQAAGMSLGTFAGAAVGGLGLGLGGYPGLGWSLAALTVVALGCSCAVRAGARRVREAGQAVS